ncbi:MAG: MBL fold metallo-hydrolase [Phycisphaeraceae bacterium]|nr:MBL fold metallo-hydrolase [Phycisphaeraceae bacterium]
MDIRVVSIGTLSRNEFWPAETPDRTPHATTTFVQSGDRLILVDPGLPPQIVAARLTERTGLAPSKITDVFLTNFRPAHRAGLGAFPNARWLISETEREVMGRSLVERFQQEQEQEIRALLQQEIALLKRIQPAPDKLANQVDLFPLPGYTPGTCGLLLCQTNSTTLVAGDAVPTIEHLEHGQVLKHAYDIEQARESFMEAIEIADVIIPGHDNLILNPTRRPM